MSFDADSGDFEVDFIFDMGVKEASVAFISTEYHYSTGTIIKVAHEGDIL